MYTCGVGNVHVPGFCDYASCFGKIGLPQQICVEGYHPCQHSCISGSTMRRVWEKKSKSFLKSLDQMSIQLKTFKISDKSTTKQLTS